LIVFYHKSSEFKESEKKINGWECRSINLDDIFKKIGFRILVENCFVNKNFIVVREKSSKFKINRKLRVATEIGSTFAFVFFLN
jgi:hypothetical protein